MRSVDVLHVAYGGLGGHVSVVNTLTRQLAPLGISTGVIAVGPAAAVAKSLGSWAEVEFVEGVEVRRRADLSSMAAAFRISRGLRPRVIVMHTLRHATPVAVAQMLGGNKVRLVTRESHGLPSRSWRVDVQSASALAWGKATVFLTQANRSGYPIRRWPLPGLRRQVVIPNGVDPSRFSPRERGAPGRSSMAALGMAARFVPGKDFETLLRGLALLRDERRDTRLMLAGDGPTRMAVEDLAHELGVDDVVEFLGQVPEADMPAFLDGLDIYVQLTDGEAFSMSIIQACAARLPVVASDVAGVHDVFVDRDTALLIAPRSPRAFADAIAELLDDDGSLAAGVSSRGYRLAIDEYSAARMAHAYLELFASIDADGPWQRATAQLDADRPQD